jgi:hypothetical protein
MNPSVICFLFFCWTDPSVVPDGAGGFVPFTNSRVMPDGTLRPYDPAVDGLPPAYDARCRISMRRRHKAPSRSGRRGLITVMAHRRHLLPMRHGARATRMATPAMVQTGNLSARTMKTAGRFQARPRCPIQTGRRNRSERAARRLAGAAGEHVLA